MTGWWESTDSRMNGWTMKLQLGRAQDDWTIDEVYLTRNQRTDGEDRVKLDWLKINGWCWSSHLAVLKIITIDLLPSSAALVGNNAIPIRFERVATVAIALEVVLPISLASKVSGGMKPRTKLCHHFRPGWRLLFKSRGRTQLPTSTCAWGEMSSHRGDILNVSKLTADY